VLDRVPGGDGVDVTAPLDLVGFRVGRLVVKQLSGRSSAGLLWICRCDCGAEVVRSSTNLTRGARHGYRSSCPGCLPRSVYGGRSDVAVSRPCSPTSWAAIAQRLSVSERTVIRTYRRALRKVQIFLGAG
jgi:hypothetical protein